MGTEGIGNNNRFNGIDTVRAFKQPSSEIKKPLDIQAELSTSNKAHPKLSFQNISAADKAQIEVSSNLTANARGDSELNHAWEDKGVKEPGFDKLDNSITTVIDKLRSISGDAVKESSAYKFLI